MPNYRYISPEQKELICRLSPSLKTPQIAHHTGISVRTIQRVSLVNNWKCDWETSATGQRHWQERRKPFEYYILHHTDCTAPQCATV